MALVTAGPLGFLAGAVIGVIATALGWNAVSGMLLKADIPLFMRLIPLSNKLNSEKVRRELSHQITDNLTREDSDFQRQIVEGFSKSFRGYLHSIAQAAEIPIE